MSSLLTTALDGQHSSQHDATTTTHSHKRNLEPEGYPPLHAKLPEQQPTTATAQSPGVLVVARMAKSGIQYAVVSTALLCTLLKQPSLLDLHGA
jgi:hypothetical protein